MTPGRFAALGAVAALAVVPIALAATSPLLAWRGAAYIAGGFAGIVALSLMFVQPLLAAGYLPGLGGGIGRRWHRRLGALLVGAVALHVAGLFVASPPDTLDALTLRAPTAFSVYGVVAMWTVAATAGLAALRRRLGLRPMTWRRLHNALALVLVVATVVHALQIQGAMEPLSKWILCLAALATTLVALADLRVIKPLFGRAGRGRA